MTVTIADAFLADILDHPEDDTLRLIYADWLDEHDQSERAEFIRVQCELMREGLHGFWCNLCEALHRRERELLGENVSTEPNTVWPRYCQWCEGDGINALWVLVPGFGIGADHVSKNHF